MSLRHGTLSLFGFSGSSVPEVFPAQLVFAAVIYSRAPSYDSRTAPVLLTVLGIVASFADTLAQPAVSRALVHRVVGSMGNYLHVSRPQD